MSLDKCHFTVLVLELAFKMVKMGISETSAVHAAVTLRLGSVPQYYVNYLLYITRI
jgi:hypothetical protein